MSLPPYQRSLLAFSHGPEKEKLAWDPCSVRKQKLHADHLRRNHASPTPPTRTQTEISHGLEQKLACYSCSVRFQHKWQDIACEIKGKSLHDSHFLNPEFLICDCVSSVCCCDGWCLFVEWLTRMVDGLTTPLLFFFEIKTFEQSEANVSSCCPRPPGKCERRWSWTSSWLFGIVWRSWKENTRVKRWEEYASTTHHSVRLAIMLEPKRKRVGVIAEGKAPPVVSGVLMARGVNAMNLKNAGIERNCDSQVGKNARTLSEGRLCADFKLVCLPCTAHARASHSLAPHFRWLIHFVRWSSDWSNNAHFRSALWWSDREPRSGRASGRILKSGFSTFARGGRWIVGHGGLARFRTGFGVRITHVWPWCGFV